MPTLPRFDASKNVNESPHLVILGAGASVATCPHGDRNGHPLPVMKNLVDIVGLSGLLTDKGVVWADEDFEQLYTRLVKTPQHAGLVKMVEERVRAYFSLLELPSQVTLYDRLLLSLRPKDLVATFNWDPLLFQAYRRSAPLRELPRVVFLHGNVGIGVCVADRVKGYTGTLCERCGQPLAPTTLLYPVAEKDYSTDPFIESQWSELRIVLQHAYFVTIFGYRAPQTDVAARAMMQQVWESNQTRVLAEIGIIDIRPESDVRENWREFLDDLHYSISPTFDTSWLMRHPRRSCETLAAATLMNNPWPNRPMPEFESLQALRDWVRPLIKEEIEHQTRATGFRVPAPPTSGTSC